MWLLSCLVVLSLAQTTENANKTSVETGSIKTFEYNVNAELALESAHSSLQGQRQNQTTSLQNFSFGTELIFDQNFSVYAELLGEQNQDNTDVYFGEVYTQYTLPFLQKLTFQLGNMYYNYGLLVQQEALLSQRPDYYSDLLVTRRGIDLGGEAEYRFTKSLPLSVSYAMFSGKTLRAGDQKTLQAEVQPQVISLNYTPSFLSAHVHSVTRRYSQGPNFQAYGFSVETTPIEATTWLSFSPMAEVWSLEYQRNDGQKRVGTTYLVGEKTEIFGFFHRWIFANEDWTNTLAGSPQISGQFQLHGLGYQFNRYFHLEYQKILAVENQQALDLTNINDDVFRIYFRL